ncbi:flavodoxin family protein [Frigidibacter albus]|uniref:Flavodoxin family protein n=1 Tax=Frigidibacter albus TaxID=1465486 RepID=A0A6L8VGC7_9RHOB|nr:NAD(P)H-dependent oxidoreductase [Frigidibacter albus]MZQ89303.1 flavodoxin family protein [Frigidibacter albus]NBE31209.1 flavodoxin family protein [Frigidibacter albus]GGH53494.1 NAD(P)H dehydrogenase [Frigidibacter albus]
MNILIVYAHPEPTSFNGAMKDLAVQTLTAQGHSVTVADLYTMGWNAVAGPSDTAVRADPDRFSLAREQTIAMESGTIAADIAAEQDRLTRADMVIFQFPVWWFGMPAILKGWVDRVFARGYAYRPGRKYDTGMFKGKLAMLATTTGTSADTYAPDGIDGDILTLLWPVHNGLLRYTGFDVLPPYVAYMPAREDEAGRALQLEGYRQRLESIETTPHLFFHSAEDYGPNERLKPGVLARSGQQRNV